VPLFETSSVTHLSFDCYGTLIDWETGIGDALEPIIKRHAIDLTRQQLLSLYAEAESTAEMEPYRPYRDILRRVTQKLAKRIGFDPTPEDLVALENSIGDWPPFADTVEALGRLKKRFKLVIISNIDNDLFAGTVMQLKVPFDDVITAADCSAYKPALTVFEQAQERLGIEKEQWLHGAQSLYHDVVPCNELGVRAVWVNRHYHQQGSGATPHATATPDLVVPDLKTLADQLVG
jgi:2-haloacid dehalogenase